jgi:hypothetical protein
MRSLGSAINTSCMELLQITWNFPTFPWSKLFCFWLFFLSSAKIWANRLLIWRSVCLYWQVCMSLLTGLYVSTLRSVCLYCQVCMSLPTGLYVSTDGSVCLYWQVCMSLLTGLYVSTVRSVCLYWWVCMSLLTGLYVSTDGSVCLYCQVCMSLLSGLYVSTDCSVCLYCQVCMSLLSGLYVSTDRSRQAVTFSLCMIEPYTTKTFEEGRSIAPSILHLGTACSSLTPIAVSISLCCGYDDHLTTVRLFTCGPLYGL